MSIKEELEQIRSLSSDGILRVDDVLFWASQHRDSELYHSIEWDNIKAGAEYRRWQIRKLIRIYLVTEKREPTVISLSVDRVLPQGGYRPIDSVMRDRTLREIALADALAELDRIRQKYAWLTELARVWAASEEVRAGRSGRRKERSTDYPLGHSPTV